MQEWFFLFFLERWHSSTCDNDSPETHKMSVLEGKLQLLCIRGGTLGGAQSKGMCLWWLLSHRSWQAGEMWRGRFTRIKWACLTFLICTSGSLTKTANLELKENRPSPPIIGDTPTERDVHWSVSTEKAGLGLCRRPESPHPHAHVRAPTHASAHMVLFVWIKPTEPLRSLYFSAAWFICSSCRSAFLASLLCSLCLCPLLHLLFPPACGFHSTLELYLRDLWKVGRAVTSGCHEYTIQTNACGKKSVLTVVTTPHS